MAEKGDVPVPLEVNATATATAAGTSSRRSSMGWTILSNSGEKLVPRYLRASTGSCHDICKYGRNHTFETKSTQPILNNVTRKSLDGGRSVDGVVLSEKKKTATTLIPKNLTRTSLDGRSSTRMLKNGARQSLEGGSSVDSVVLSERKKRSWTRILKKVARKSLDGGSSIDSLVRLERQKTTSTRMPKNVARKSFDSGSSVDSVIPPERRKTTSTRAKAEFLSTSSIISEADLTTFIRPKLSLESFSFPRPLQREVLNERKKKLLGEPRTLPKPRSHTANALKNLKPKVSSTTRNLEDSVVQIVAKAKEKMLPEKSDKISKLKSIKVNPLRSAVSRINSRRNKDSKMGKSSGTSKVAAKKVVAVSTGSISSSSIDGTANIPCINLKGVPLENHNTIEISEHVQVRSEEVEGETFRNEEVQGETFQSEKVEEKTLYVIKIENEEIPYQSDQNETDVNMEPLPSSPPKSLSPTTSPHISTDVEDQVVSEYTESEVEEEDSYSESNETGSMKADNASSEGGKKGRSQNLRMLKTKEMDPQCTKLSFRRGKVFDIRSENYSPRRLKFRPVRLLGESQRAGDGLRKNFKRGKEIDSNTTTAKETVVLRHQDVQGKKDAHGLYNHVIEETASKLVETRKSKVKALVGAFETVIILQDRKPSRRLDTVS